MGAGKRLNGRGKIRRRKGKNESRSPWDSSLNRPVPKPFKILACDWAQKYFLCPITGKDFKWFRNWSVKRRIPGHLLSFVTFLRPFSLFPAPTNCPWVSEDALERVFKKFRFRGSFYADMCVVLWTEGLTVTIK